MLACDDNDEAPKKSSSTRPLDDTNVMRKGILRDHIFLSAKLIIKQSKLLCVEIITLRRIGCLPECR